MYRKFPVNEVFYRLLIHCGDVERTTRLELLNSDEKTTLGIAGIWYSFSDSIRDSSDLHNTCLQ